MTFYNNFRRIKPRTQLVPEPDPDVAGPFQSREISHLRWYYNEYYKQGPIFGAMHAVYRNISRYGVPEKYNPNWINMVRDPLEQHVSLFYHGSYMNHSETALEALATQNYSV